MHRIHGLCQLNYEIIHKHIQTLFISLFDAELSSYDCIIAQIISEIFQRYGTVYEIPLLMEVTINLYIGKTGRIPQIRHNIHNCIVTNMVNQCWNQRTFSPSQCTEVWQSFIDAFEWVQSIENSSNKLTAFCDSPLVWNVMAHFLNYAIIDEFNSQICMALIKQLKPYLRQLMDVLLFQSLFTLISVQSTPTDTKPNNKNKCKLSEPIKNGLDRLNQCIDDTKDMKTQIGIKHLRSANRFGTVQLPNQ